MKNLFIITAFIFFLNSCQTRQALVNISSVNQVDQVDFSNKNNVLLDVRTPEEYNEGHLPGADNINLLSDDFDAEIEKLDKKKNYYVYCRSGKRSTEAAGKMENAGFTNVANLKDGYISYEKED